VTETPETFAVAGPVLVMVTVCGVYDVPTATGAKLSDGWAA
jgi:hypothetical protein